GSGGTVLASDGGAAPGTLSTGALASIAGSNNISVTAQTSVTFNDLASQGGSLNLQTMAGHTAAFTALGGALTFANTSNTLSTAGGNITLSASTGETLGQLNTNGGNLTLVATGGALTQTGAATPGLGTGRAKAGGADTPDAPGGRAVQPTSTPGAGAAPGRVGPPAAG